MATNRSDLTLSVGLDARPVRQQIEALKREIGQGFTTAMSQAMRTGVQAGLQNVGGATARAFGPSGGGAGAAGGSAAAAYRAETSALVRLQNLRARALRQLGDTGQLTARAERLTNLYTQALGRYGTNAERTLQIDRARRLELDKISAEIARQGGLLRVLRDEGEATRKTFLGIGLNNGGREMLTSGGVNLAQSVIASGGSLDALAVGAATQLPELLQAISISGGAAAAGVTGLAAAIALAGPILGAWSKRARDAANAAATLQGAVDQLAAARERYGADVAAFPPIERQSLITTTRAAIDEQTKRLDAARDRLVRSMRDAANSSSTINTPGGLVELDDSSLDQLVELRRQAEVFQRVLKETNSVAEAFAKSGLDERAFAADAAEVREASGTLEGLNRQLNELQGKKLPDLSVGREALSELRETVKLMEQLALIPDAARRAAYETSARAVSEARQLGLTPAQQAELVQLRQREAAAQGKIAAGDEADTRRRQAAETTASLEREAAIQRELAGIRDQDARARREVELRARAEAEAAGLTGDAMRQQVGLAVQIHDAKARMARLDAASARSVAEQADRLDQQLKTIRAAAEARERMADAVQGVRDDLGERWMMVQAQTLALKGGPRAVEATQRGMRDFQSLMARLDTHANPALAQDSLLLQLDARRLSEAEHALERVTAVLSEAEDPCERLKADLELVEQAFRRGEITTAQYAAAWGLLERQMADTEAQMARQRTLESAQSGDVGAGLTVAVAQMRSDAEDTVAIWRQAFGSIDQLGREAFASIVTGTGDVRAAAASLLEDLSYTILRAMALRAVLSAFGGGAPPAEVPPPGSYNAQTGMFGRAARGRVVDHGDFVTRFARGGLPDVVSTPTAFPMRNGLGIAGDASRPEAILPLHRDASGRLGVGAKRGAGGGDTHLTISSPVTVSVEGGAGLDEAQAQKLGAMLGQQINLRLKEALVQESRPGGVLHRRYG